MSAFRNAATGVVVRVDNSKDARFSEGWDPADAEPKKAPAKKASSRKSSN